jgi:hypothetical protein
MSMKGSLTETQIYFGFHHDRVTAIHPCFDSSNITNTSSPGRETVCGQTVSELIDLLGLPNMLDSIVAVARGWICDSVLS